jgi:hypothetical protein
MKWCESKITMFCPSVCAYFIASKVTCEPCPYKINKCLLVQGMPLGIDLVKNDKNSLKSKDVTNVFLHCHACPWAIIFYVIIFYPHTFKYEES